MYHVVDMYWHAKLTGSTIYTSLGKIRKDSVIHFMDLLG